ncbi:uncharacterized protein N7473_001623 [Penicillium subrubescens]|uniref:uncharacterized protein n=1 Tax=Penicillium subrubescens TaxID=1316194 RepID=UPI002544E5AE|nr:uncharacterized protein N7473_001623 [Penicillium subrubescens]KAJ5904707.1 hypothetical protein N7473_001623 [Penicillium subrubescens]
MSERSSAFPDIVVHGVPDRILDATGNALSTKWREDMCRIPNQNGALGKPFVDYAVAKLERSAAENLDAASEEVT